jgi:hypothetical protein
MRFLEMTFNRSSRIAILAAAVPFSATAVPAFEPNDFPTEARVEYVIGCMNANGGMASLKQCSCVVDVIASLIEYQDYTRVKSLLAAVREKKRRPETLRAKRNMLLVKTMQQADIEAEVRCF